MLNFTIYFYTEVWKFTDAEILINYTINSHINGKMNEKQTIDESVLLMQSNSDAPPGRINHRYRNEYRLSGGIETVSSYWRRSLGRPSRSALFLIRWDNRYRLSDEATLQTNPTKWVFDPALLRNSGSKAYNRTRNSVLINVLNLII